MALKGFNGYPQVCTYLPVLTTGWIPAYGWVYASATTITVPAGATSIYTIGNKFKLVSNSVVLQGYIIGVTSTLLTVVGDALTNYTFSDCYFSNVDTPIGFPQKFSYTVSGISAAGVTKTGRFSITGRICKVEINCNFTGAITFTTHPGLPVPASANLLPSSVSSALMICGVISIIDNGTAWRTFIMYPAIAAGGTVVNIYRVSDAASMSATVPHTWANTDGMYISIQYEI